MQTLLTAAEAADRLIMDRATFNRSAKAGKIPTAMRLPGKRGARLFDPMVIESIRADRAHEAEQRAAEFRRTRHDDPADEHRRKSRASARHAKAVS